MSWVKTCTGNIYWWCWCSSDKKLGARPICMLRREGGLVIAQPPSALWEYLSSNVHGRNSYHVGIYGDVSKWAVRRANAIARNFASRLKFAIGFSFPPQKELRMPQPQHPHQKRSENMGLWHETFDGMPMWFLTVPVFAQGVTSGAHQGKAEPVLFHRAAPRINIVCVTWVSISCGFAGPLQLHLLHWNLGSSEFKNRTFSGFDQLACQWWTRCKLPAAPASWINLTLGRSEVNSTHGPWQWIPDIGESQAREQTQTSSWPE